MDMRVTLPDNVSLAEAKAKLSALIDRVEAGDSVSITRHGKVVARLVPAVKPRVPLDLERARRLRETMKPQSQTVAEFMREFRDDERY